MIVLGYSGLDAAVRHALGQADLRPGEERMVQGLDSAAALVIDGEVVAAVAEERFCDEKHTNRFPEQAIRYCLATAGIGIEDVASIAHGFDYRRGQAFFRRFDQRYYDEVLAPDNQLLLWRNRFAGQFRDDQYRPVVHHLAHAASAYFPSGYERALCIVCDGMGELESLTAYTVDAGRFTRLGIISIPNSIGLLYSIITRHLGFSFNADEYKLMGLAPYGDPARYRAFFANLVELHADGRYQLHYERWLGTVADDHQHRAVLAYLEHEVLTAPGDVDAMSQAHYDFAAAAQEVLETALTHTLSHWQSTSGMRRLCMAGGVALNCTFNGKLLSQALFDDVFIQPAAGDDGTALGAALLTAAELGDVPCCGKYQEMPFYGPSFSSAEILVAARAFGERIEVTEFASVEGAAEDAAQGVADDLVQAWFQGRMEFGPRALGNRTIFANPASPDIKSRVNQIVKLREGFRPFAPAVLVERADEYFAIGGGAPPFEFMLATCQVRPAWAPRLPGITHVDGSARVQTVDQRKNPQFYDLIERIGRKTGIYCTLNTSFNVRGQAMIAAPDTAIETFLRVKLDRLYLQNIRVTKPQH